MSWIKTILGYTWAVLMLPLVLVTFVGMNGMAEKLVVITGLSISPWFSGGEVIETINHPGYQTLVHRPVFEGLFCERQTGFIQIRWQAATGSLPARIQEEIDYNRDGTVDFLIKFNRNSGKVNLVQRNNSIRGHEILYQNHSELAIRVKLLNSNQ